MARAIKNQNHTEVEKIAKQVGTVKMEQQSRSNLSKGVLKKDWPFTERKKAKMAEILTHYD